MLAFAHDGQPGTDEAELIDELRANGKARLSLVAEIDGRIVGHVFCSDVTVESGTARHTIVGLGPIGVLPEYQKQGIGSALMQATIEECRRRGDRAIFLLGHVSYYPRFGFEAARHRGLIYQDARDSAMVLELTPGALDGISGNVSFEPEFNRFE